jgi:hypothetical protein
MKPRFGPIAFMIGFCVTYALSYWFNLPLFLYYPLHGDFSSGLHPLPKGAGPGMAWYGFMANAGIAAVILALVIPDRLFDRFFRNYLWLFPCAAMLICLYLLRLFFLQG